MPQHPDFPLEAARVRDTVLRARGEEDSSLPLVAAQQERVTQLTVESGGDFSVDLLVAQNMLDYLRQRCRYLHMAQDKPYFSRVDFHDGRQEQSYYIGKWGLLDPETDRPYVVDWRSPIADLYYTGQVGPAQYQTPGGPVNGEITLKRILGCQKGELTSLIEANILSQDEYLNAILSDHADARLRDIVTTIQAEQNAILRHERTRPIIVQGVAGAGKTTVALHRVTWLLYTYQDTMAPRNLMVIAPNPLFLNYISAVLPDLGVESVIQETFHGLTCRLCGASLPPLQDADTLLALIDPAVADEEKKSLADVARFKGSLAFKACLARYVDWRSRQLLPEGDVCLASVRMLSHSELEQIYCRDLAPFPLMARPKELAKHLRTRLTETAVRLKALYQSETEKRANLLRAGMPQDSPQRQSRMARLYAVRDQRIAQIDALAKDYVKNWIKSLPKLSLLEEYRRFLDPQAPFGLPEGVTPRLWQNLCRSSLERLDEQHTDSGDLPALLDMQKAFLGLNERLDIHHTVIDEAQDLSPYMFDTLMALCHNASFTIVGDLNQGIHSYRGVRDWAALADQVFGPGNTDYFELITSYRSTVEIMGFADQVSRRHPYPGQQSAKPVLRHGSPPRLIKSGAYPAREIAQEARSLLAQGCVTMAIIEKLPADCKKLYRQLSAHLDGNVRLLTDQDTQYTGGVMVLPAHLSKGLEFDGVIIANANSENWPDDVLHGRLLFVCLTRPLHHLTLFYRGEPSALLPAGNP